MKTILHIIQNVWIHSSKQRKKQEKRYQINKRKKKDQIEEKKRSTEYL